MGFEPQWKPIYIFTTLNLCFIVKHNNKAHILTHTGSQKVFKKKVVCVEKNNTYTVDEQETCLSPCVYLCVCVCVVWIEWAYTSTCNISMTAAHTNALINTQCCVSHWLKKNFSAFHTCEGKRTTHMHTIKAVSIHFFLYSSSISFSSRCRRVSVCFVWMAMYASPFKMSVPLKQPRAICMYGRLFTCVYSTYRIELVCRTCMRVYLYLCACIRAHTYRHRLFSSVEHRHAAQNE